MPTLRSSSRRRPRPAAESLESRSLLSGFAFGTSPLATAGRSPSSVTAGDFSGDGVPDLIETYGARTEGYIPQSAAIGLRVAHGDGTFDAPKLIEQAGYDPQSVVLGDFNGDGKLDFVVQQTGLPPSYPSLPNGTSSSFQVFLNTGNATFNPLGVMTVSAGNQTVAVGDLDGDGKLDLVVGTQVFGGNGDGTFTEKAGIGSFDSLPIHSQALADLNGDGKLDLVESIDESVTNGPIAAGGYIDVRIGRGDGTFADGTLVPIGQVGPTDQQVFDPRSIRLTDLNGDGRIDLAFLAGGLHVLVGQGDASFGAEEVYDVGADPRGLASGDFDGDGFLDLAITAHGSGVISLVHGRGDGTFDAPHLSGSGYNVHALGDLNGDGIADLVTFDPDGTEFQIRLGQTNGTFGSALIIQIGLRTPTALAIGDINGDGFPDIVGSFAGINTSINTGQHIYYSLDYQGLAILPGRGDGTFDTANVVADSGTRSNAVAIVDVDGDSIPDLVETYAIIGDTPNSGVSVRRGRGGGSFDPAVRFINSASGGGRLTVGDLDNDGRPDLALNSSSSAVLLNRSTPGMPNYVALPVPAVIPLSGPITITDLDGDGVADLVGLSGSSVAWVRGSGDGQFGTATVIQTIPDTDRVTSILATSLNGDRLPDLVVTTQVYQGLRGTIDILHSRTASPGTFDLVLQLDSSPTRAGASIADLNRDGKPDIVAVANPITVLLSKADGSFATQTGFPVTVLPTGLAVGDFNRDGKLDLATLSTADGTGTVLLSTTATPTYPFTVQPDPATRTVGDADSFSTVATISDTNPLGKASDFQATIDWGDGSTVQAATIMAVAGVAGRYAVTGQHDYRNARAYTVTVLVRSVFGGAPVTLTSTVTVADSPVVVPTTPLLMGTLELSSVSGATLTQYLSRDNTPDFRGVADPGATIYLFARPINSAGVVETAGLVGITRAGTDSAWSLPSARLYDGSYGYFVVATTADGRQATVELIPTSHPLLIDTLPPTILDAQVDPRQGRITVTYADGGTGLDPSGAVARADLYRFRRGVARPIQNLAVSRAVAVAGTLPTDPVTVTLTIRGGRRISPNGAYLLRIRSSEVFDRLGNRISGDAAISFQIRGNQAKVRSNLVATGARVQTRSARPHPHGPAAR